MNIGRTPSFGAIHIIYNHDSSLQRLETLNKASLEECSNQDKDNPKTEQTGNFIHYLKGMFSDSPGYKELKEPLSVENRLNGKGFEIVGPFQVDPPKNKDEITVVISNANTQRHKDFVKGNTECMNDLDKLKEKTLTNPNQPVQDWLKEREQAGAEVMPHLICP